MTDATRRVIEGRRAAYAAYVAQCTGMTAIVPCTPLSYSEWLKARNKSRRRIAAKIRADIYRDAGMTRSRFGGWE